MYLELRPLLQFKAQLSYIMVPLLDRSRLKVFQNKEIQNGHNIDVYTLFATLFYSLVSTVQLVFSISSQIAGKCL